MAAVIGFAGYSGSGKTTLAVRVVRRLLADGYKIAVVKHDAHGHYKEASGTDSSAYIDAGAQAVIVMSPQAVVSYERREQASLDERLAALRDVYDLIVVEGFKAAAHPKIAVIRTPEQAQIVSEAANVVAIAADIPLERAGVPVLSLHDPAAIAGFIAARIRASSGSTGCPEE